MTALELDRMEHLTRRYARHSQGAAGFGAVLGGLAFFFQGGLLFGYGLGYFLRNGCDCRTRGVWKYFLSNELTPPLLLQLLLISIPLVWWAVRFKLHRWATAAYGEVQQTRTGFRMRYARMDYLGSLAMGPALLLYFSFRKGLHGHPAAWTPFFLGAALALLAPLVAWTQRRSHSCEDLEAGQMLFLGSALTLNLGIGISVALMVPPFLVLATIYGVLGLWHHRQFRKVRAELAALPVPE